MTDACARWDGGRETNTSAVTAAVKESGLLICNRTLVRVNYMAQLLSTVAGLTSDLVYNTLRVYRIHSAGGPAGRATAISDGSATGSRPNYAFYGSGNGWNSDKTGIRAVGSYIGWDYGGGGLHSTRLVKIRWVATQAPQRIRFEYSDDGRKWYSAGEFGVEFPDSVQLLRQDEFALENFGPHRYWRAVAVEMPDNRRFGVVEIEFIE